MAKMSDKIESGKNERKAKLLLVIEEAENLSHHTNFLRAQGHRVFACTSYDRALALLGRETFDLVAVSQGGTAFEGKEIVVRALETDRSIPVLVLTRVLDMQNYLEAMQLGAVDYLEMPVPPVELIRILRTHIRNAPVV